MHPLRTHSKRSPGFTLLELLVAMAIFALLAVMAYGGLNSILTTREVVDMNMARLSEIQRTVMFLGRDLRQAANRGIRDEYGDRRPPLVSNVANSSLNGMVLELTRDGYPNPLGAPRSNMQRVAYRVEDDTLYRLSWPVLDRAIDTRPYEAALCEHITALRLRFLDYQDTWHTQWPPQAVEAAPPALPKAVEFTLELPDWGEITRLYQLVETL